MSFSNKLSLFKSISKDLILKIHPIYLKQVPTNPSRIYVVITIDTEQDVDAQYNNLGTYRNIVSGISVLLSAFKKYSLKATWMVTPDVAELYPVLMNNLRDSGHEIGCHIHPEYFTCASIDHIHHRDYLCNFPYEEQKSMVADATKIIRDNCGTPPVSFRAGRFGISSTTLEILRQTGYHIDTSVCPSVSWKCDGGPDWSRYKNYNPYFVQNLLEVPITILNIFGLNYWFRPSVSPTSTMINLINFVRLYNNTPIVLNMMFHSMETVDPNPYVDSQIFSERLETSLKFLTEINAEFVTLSELYEILNRNGVSRYVGNQ